MFCKGTIPLQKQICLLVPNSLHLPPIETNIEVKHAQLLYRLILGRAAPDIKREIEVVRHIYHRILLQENRGKGRVTSNM